ncbi:hypothetical protein [Paraburkholderia tropica]|uniref:hypothetical protein n=1 Tax=Paraburkholderia tropica TaxID=92647 RepID=UPI002AB7C31F|nr:hypothetical protein [Paraburkholderia tropica]
MDLTSPLSHDRTPDGAAFFLNVAQRNVTDHIVSLGVMPPAMFSSLDELKAWACGSGIEISSLKDQARTRACLLRTRTGQLPEYEAVWVSVANDKYREAMLSYIREGFLPRNKVGGDESTRFEPRPEDRAKLEAALKTVHADHVINRARLRPNHPDGWVMLLPVPAKSNSGYGSMVERGLPAVAANETRIDIDAMLCVKLFGLKNPPGDSPNLAKVLSMLNGMIPDCPAKDALLKTVEREWTQRFPETTQAPHPHEDSDPSGEP